MHRSPWIPFFLIEICLFPVIAFLFLQFGLQHKQPERKVLGAVSAITYAPTAVPGTPFLPSPTPFSEVAPLPTIAPTPLPTVPPPTPTASFGKSAYAIAIIGDSMVDTMGERLEYLEHALTKKYPSVSFTLYNYGIGSENVEMGFARLNKTFDHQDRHYVALSKLKPDILIVGSFAYNPFFPYDRDRHWIGLTKLVEEAKKIAPQVYMLAEIAPLRAGFGRGPQGVNWDENTTYEHSAHVMAQLENVVGLSPILHVPAIDAYHASHGLSKYVNSSDGIHPSVAGHEFMAQLIADFLELR